MQRRAEALFGTDFSGVRIHVGPQPASIGALAFTTGNDIYFAPGQYSPTTPHGLRLLGHELTHVVQQRAGRARNPFGAGVAVVLDPGLEAEAERMGGKAGMLPVQGQPPAPPVVPGLVAQRKPAPGAGQGQVVQPFPFLGLEIGYGTLALGALGVYGLYRLYQYATSTSPGYYVKILMRPGYLGNEQATQLADSTLNMLEQRFMSKRGADGNPKPSHRAMRRGTWLRDIDPNGKLHIIGHGEPVPDPRTRIPQYASSLSGYSVAEVARMLTDDYQLPASFRGEIVLLVCHSGSRTDEQPSLAEDLLREIRGRGPAPVSIKALKGTGTVDEDTGRTKVRPDESVGAYERLNDIYQELLLMQNTPHDIRDQSRLVTAVSRALVDPLIKALLPLGKKEELIGKMKGGRVENVLSQLMRYTLQALAPHRRGVSYAFGATHKVVYT